MALPQLSRARDGMPLGCYRHGMPSDRLDPATRARVSREGGKASRAAQTDDEWRELSSRGGRARSDHLDAQTRSAVSATGAAAIHSAPGLARRLVKKYRSPDTTDADRAEAVEILREGGLTP